MELFFKLAWNKLLRTRVLRIVFIYTGKKRRSVVVIKNNTKKKLFLLRKENDFSEKKAVRLEPGKMFNIVIKPPYNEKVFIHDGEKIVYTVREAVFEIVIDIDIDTGYYTFTPHL